MQVSHQIDQLIASLNILKPKLSDNQDLNSQKFSEILKESLNYSLEIQTEPLGQSTESNVPFGVDPNMGYDPTNPRKPNMRELTEALSGRTIEELYAENKEQYLSLTSLASELLYGVVGSGNDTRNWSKIMRSENILISAQTETGKMYEPEINIQSISNDDAEVTSQIAVITDKEGTVLREIPGKSAKAEELLNNFGITSNSITDNLIAKIDPTKFDKNLLSFLEDFKTKPRETEAESDQHNSDNLVNVDLKEIPNFEQNKL